MTESHGMTGSRTMTDSGATASTLVRRVALPAGAALVVLVALIATAAVPSTSVPPPTVVPVVSTELVCPNVTSAPNVSTRVSAVTPSEFATGIGAALIGTPARAVAIGSIAGGAHALVKAAPTGSTAVVGRASGGRAPGFALDQLTASSRTADHGLAGATCTEPTNDAWFVGTGSGVGHTSMLYLTDPEPTSATVDVDIYNTGGAVAAPSVQGVVVPAHGRRVLSLDRVAPGAGTVAVHVTASAGRVGAAVFDAQVDGLIPQGADWVPMAESPARRVVVPGLGGGQGSRRLTVFAPGEGTATVHVTLVGTQGSFTPTGAASVEIDRGKVTTLDLGPAAANDQTGAVVESDVPIVAGVRWRITSGRVDELAFSAGTPALTAPAVISGNQVDAGFGTALMLTAPGAAAKVSVQVLVSGVPSGVPRVVTVAGGTTARTPIARGVKGVFDVVLTPVAGGRAGAGGSVFAAVLRTRAVDGASGTTVSVVRNSRVTVPVPQARPDLDVGLGR